MSKYLTPEQSQRTAEAMINKEIIAPIPQNQILQGQVFDETAFQEIIGKHLDSGAIKFLDGSGPQLEDL